MAILKSFLFGVLLASFLFGAYWWFLGLVLIFLLFDDSVFILFFVFLFDLMFMPDMWRSGYYISFTLIAILFAVLVSRFKNKFLI